MHLREKYARYVQFSVGSKTSDGHGMCHLNEGLFLATDTLINSVAKRMTGFLMVNYRVVSISN